ncbi:MAG: CpsD/CapB family tyrosine-protein kinase [Thermoleophilia bacterium]
MANNDDYHLYVKFYPNSVIAEAFRSLRTNLVLTDIDKGLHSIVITSAERGEGKSTVCANLAVIMAQAEKRVLLIDCDLRLPSQDKLFNLPRNGGLTSIISHLEDEGELVFEESLPGLTVIGSGPPPPNPSEFLGSARFRSFLRRTEKHYDMVIIDAPPIGLVTDAAILSSMVDGTVLVLDAQYGHRNVAIRAKAALDQVNANVIGVVLNNVRPEKSAYYAYKQGAEQYRAISEDGNAA